MSALGEGDPFPPHVIELSSTRLTVTHPDPDAGCGLCSLVLAWEAEGRSLPQEVSWTDDGAVLTGELLR